MSTETDNLINALASQVGWSETDVIANLSEAINAGLLTVEDDPADPDMVRLIAAFPKGCEQ